MPNTVIRDILLSKQSTYEEKLAQLKAIYSRRDLSLMLANVALPDLSGVPSGKLPILVKKGTELYIYGAKQSGGAFGYTKLDIDITKFKEFSFPQKPGIDNMATMERELIPEEVCSEILNKAGDIFSPPLPLNLSLSYLPESVSITPESLKSLISLLAKLLQSNEVSIREISLVKNGLTGEDIRPLAESLKDNRFLKILFLSENKLGDLGMEILAEGLKGNSSLNQLLVDENHIGNQGASKLDEALANSHISAIYFARNNVTDKITETLITTVKNHPNLIDFNLKGCWLSRENLARIEKQVDVNKAQFVRKQYRIGAFITGSQEHRPPLALLPPEIISNIAKFVDSGPDLTKDAAGNPFNFYDTVAKNDLDGIKKFLASLGKKRAAEVVNMQNSCMATALLIAIDISSPKMVDLLLKHGADPQREGCDPSNLVQLVYFLAPKSITPLELAKKKLGAVELAQESLKNAQENLEKAQKNLERVQENLTELELAPKKLKEAQINLQIAQEKWEAAKYAFSKLTFEDQQANAEKIVSLITEQLAHHQTSTSQTVVSP
jgi:hypothetical protein